MLERVLDAAESGATLVTPNRRLARTLRHAYDSRQRERGREAWPSADALPWNAWLMRLWHTLDAEGAFLSRAQEQTLWETAVLETHAALVQPASIAKLAWKAWNLCHAWRVPLDFAAAGGDAAVFLKWSKAYSPRCQKNRWLDSAQLPDRLIEMAADIALRNEVLLAGFDELSPQQRELATALHCREIPALRETRAANCVRVGCSDAKDEIATAARWARALLEKDRQRRIGIVVPALHAQRAQIEKIFDDVFHPASALPGAAVPGRAFNISLAPALSNSPIIAAALGVLELGQGDPTLAQIGQCLRSPFITGGQAEMTQRALLDAKLREDRELVVPWPALLRRARELTPLLAQRFALLLGVRVRDTLTTGEWRAVFRNLLQAAGWPGDRVLNSDEYQALFAWDKVLSEFCTLDSLMRRLDYREAVAQLRRLTSDTLFQPESAEVPVQILGVLEARGQIFDHLWVMGLHDEAWPAPCGPDPFIPLALQRKFDLPHATPERELAYARAALQAMMSSADDVVLSWPWRDGDVELAPSRLILDTPLCTDLARGSFVPYGDVIHRAGALERFDDDYGTPLTGSVVPSAGNRLFEYQAACPFKAFAAFRLGAQGLDEPAFGMDVLARGSLAHKVIAAIWNKLKTQAALLAADNLPEVVSRAVEHAVAEEARRRPLTFTPAFAALEKRRLNALMLEWLELDRARPPFDSVACEVKQSKTVAGVTVNLRIDRIDRLQNGEAMLVDYKTGECKRKDWFDDRPDAPQLPLYAYGEGNVAAISYAVLRRGEVSYSGYSRKDEIAAGVDRREDWDAMLRDWKRVLEALARQFLSGAAHVDPKKFPDTCRLCEMTPLCRVGERRANE